MRPPFDLGPHVFFREMAKLREQARVSPTVLDYEMARLGAVAADPELAELIATALEPLADVDPLTASAYAAREDVDLTDIVSFAPRRRTRVDLGDRLVYDGYGEIVRDGFAQFTRLWLARFPNTRSRESPPRGLRAPRSRPRLRLLVRPGTRRRNR